MDNTQDLMDVFLKEAHDLIDEMRKELSLLSEEPNSANRDNIFRCAHTLKNSSGIVGLDNLYELALALERTTRAVKDEKCEINSELISLLSKSFETCRKLVDVGEVEEIGELLEKLEKVS
jgi:two-component system chemotaxis sensor kinase CheA